MIKELLLKLLLKIFGENPGLGLNFSTDEEKVFLDGIYKSEGLNHYIASRDYVALKEMANEKNPDLFYFYKGRRYELLMLKRNAAEAHRKLEKEKVKLRPEE